LQPSKLTNKWLTKSLRLSVEQLVRLEQHSESLYIVRHCPLCSQSQANNSTVAIPTPPPASTNGPQPSRENPLGNPAWPGDTTIGSPDWSSYLTTQYNSSFIKLYNLAHAGGTIDDTIDPSPFGALSFRQQVSQLYLPEYGNGKGGWTAADSMFMVWFGVNDVMLLNAKVNASAYIDALTESYVGQAEKVTTSPVYK